MGDYLITAALSSLSCFMYLGVAHPVDWAIGAVCLIGVLNYFGPRHSGNLALGVALATVAVVVLLAILAIPFIGEAIKNFSALFLVF